ncbi:hypothetical protein L5515_010086 [Caenorhabditis briggsae]|nr:hypothetical protein L5515_010086 [Caenorhabditis briggsae]
MFLPIFDPTESQIGCAERPDCRVVLCAVGPKKNPSESNFQKGAPGSACPNGPNPVGLCKALNMGENGDGEDKGSNGDGEENGDGEDNGSNQSSLIALLLIVLLI